MFFKMKRILPHLLFVVLLLSSVAHGQVWTKVSEAAIANKAKLDFKNFPATYELYNLDIEALKTSLAGAPDRKLASSKAGVMVVFPVPGGQLETFEVYEASIMHPTLAAKYPDIKSYVGRSTLKNGKSVRFSTTIFGLHTINFSTNDGTSFTQPYTKDLTTYLVYRKDAITNLPDFSCQELPNPELDLEHIQAQALSENSVQSNTGIFRTYRLAITCTVEYATFHVNAAGLQAGTTSQKIAAVLAAMNVTMTRVNGLYERDAAITMELIANNDQVINISSDNFNNASGGALLNSVQSYMDSNIGSANYDIGHIFSTGGGGVAILGSVCLAGQKSRGVTGSDAPVGDAFDIDYVAHEMGHQFGANHTFSSQTGSCNGNINQATAVEPGSGTTIMAYAGICPPQNVQNNSDAAFHAVSLAQINSLVASTANCSVNTPTNNESPVIQQIADYTIPYSTPFFLRGNATDVDDTNLSYCWEQTNNESSTQPPININSSGPNFRSRIPNASPTRFFPQFSSVINNNISPAYEVVSSVERTYNFALTVRDNDIVNGGQTERENITVNVANTGPFTVTAPNSSTSVVAASNLAVTWNVAGTTENGINAKFVDIWILTTTSNPFGTLLASKVPNDGAETVTLPGTIAGTNRILIVGHNNIFYDISNANFTTTNPANTFSIGFNGIAGEQNKAVCAGSQTTFSIAYNTFGTFTDTATLSAGTLPAGVSVAFSPSTISATGTITMTVSTTANVAAGIYAIPVTATAGATSKTANFYIEVSSPNFPASVLTSPANNATGISTTPNLSWSANAEATAYDIQVATDAGFNTVVANLSTTATTISTPELFSLQDYFWRIRPKNAGCTGPWSSAFRFTTKYCDVYVATSVPINISTQSAQTYNSVLNIPTSENITINEVEVSVKINHTWISDLTCRLISPTGTNIILFQNQCNTGQPGNEDVDATFTASGSALSCLPSNPRIAGRVIPQQSFANLNNQNAQGNWTLRITDNSAEDGGQLVSWSLKLCGAAAPLSVEDNSTDFGISIYPNPNSGNFTISSAKALDAKSEITVYDMRGRVLHQSNTAGAGPLNEIISLQNAQAGVYLVSISGAKFKEVKRIVVE